MTLEILKNQPQGVTYLQKVGPDLLISAAPGKLLGQLSDPLRGVCQGLGASDQLSLGPFAAPDELRQVRHQVGDLLGSCYQLVVRMVPLFNKRKRKTL